jgi:hypothetical protein
MDRGLDTSPGSIWINIFVVKTKPAADDRELCYNVFLELFVPSLKFNYFIFGEIAIHVACLLRA